MKYAVCPRCRNLLPRSVVFCLFCGKALKRGTRRIAQESPNTPREKLLLQARRSAVLSCIADSCPWDGCSSAFFTP
jgi:hypothetical protein